MISLLFAVALAATEPTPGPASTPPEDPAATLVAAQDLYNQSCGVKGYASYDDLCGPLRDSIREARKLADKAARQKQKPSAKSEPLAGQAQPQR